MMYNPTLKLFHILSHIKTDDPCSMVSNKTDQAFIFINDTEDKSSISKNIEYKR